MISNLQSTLPGPRSKEYKKIKNDFSFFEQCYDFFARIQHAKKFITIWSMYEIRDFTKIAYKGTFTLHRDTDEYWGKSTSCTLTNPTYLQLWAAADKLIRKSGDHHHVYIEGFKRRGDKLTICVGS